MMQSERIWEFLQRLSPITRSCLLNELERLDLSGVEIPGSSDIQARLRAEFRKDGSTQNRASTPSRCFFAPLEPLLFDGAPDHDHSGRIPRASLAPIWEWITRDLLPTMARDYNAQMTDLIATDKQREAKQVAASFQTKVVKYLESTLKSPESAEQTRSRLATYTAAKSAYGDLTKIMCALRTREALAKFEEKLPARIAKLDKAAAARTAAQLDAFAKGAPDAVPFALTLIERRLKTSWQLINLAMREAASTSAADVAAAPYAIAVSMVLDLIDDKRIALRIALKNNRVLVAKELLTCIYDIEYALQMHIDDLNESEWGIRLNALLNAVAELVDAEVSRFPEEVGHVLGSRSLRSHNSLAGRLNYLAWKGRDAIGNGAAHFRKLVGQA